MRNIARLAGLDFAAVAVMGMRAPAFAEKSTDSSALDAIEVVEGSEGVAGAQGGESTNMLACLVNVAVLAPNNDQVCIADAEGGDGMDPEDIFAAGN